MLVVKGKKKNSLKYSHFGDELLFGNLPGPCKLLVIDVLIIEQLGKHVLCIGLF